jgi:PAS domain S-box-containing protein
MERINSKSFTNKVYLITISVILSIIIILSGIFYYNNEVKSTRNQKSNELKAIAELKNKEIENWYKDEINDAGLISGNKFLRKYITEFFSNESVENLKVIADLLENIRKEHGYKNVFLCFSDGRIKYTGTSENIDTIFYNNIIKDQSPKHIFTTDIYKRFSDSTTRLDFIAPVFNEDNRIIATIILSMDPNDFLFPLIQSWPLVSKSSETLLLRREKDSVLFLNNLRHYHSSAMKIKIPLSRQDLPSVQAVKGYVGEIEGKDYRGIEVLAYVNHIDGTSWYIESKIDKDELFARLKDIAYGIFIFTVLLMIIVIGALAFIYSYKQKNFFKALWKSTEEYKITLNSIGDAVITTDESGNIKFLNPVAETLTGWKMEDSVGLPLEQVFRIFSTRTKEPVENPVDKVINSGSIVGLANHTILISKDGFEYQIADSAAPIINDYGSITGVVLVFRNVTEEYEIREMLIKSEETFRSIVDSSPMGIHLYQVINDRLVFVGANPAADRILHTDNKQFIGKFIEEAFPPLADTEIPERYKRAALQGESWFSEQINYDHKGISGAFEVSAFRISTNKAAIMFRDITSRKRAEESLQKSEALLSAAISQSPSGIIIADAPDVRIRYANQAAFGIRGKSSFKLTDIDYKEHTRNWNTFYTDGITPYPPEELPLSKAILEGVVTENIEVIIKNESGESKWVSANAAPIKNPKGEIISGIVVFHDITESKQFEEALLQSEEKYRRLFDNINVGVALYKIITDLNNKPVDFIWLEVNPEYETLTKLKKEDVIGRTGLEISPNMEQKWIEIYGEVALTGKSISLIDRSDYLNKYWEINAYSPKPLHFAVAIKDITERIKTEEALRQSEERFRRLSEDMPIFISTFLPDGTMIYVNETLAKTIGLNAEELIGKNFFDILISDKDVIKKRLNSLTREIPNETYEQKYIGKDGIVRYRQWSNRAFFDGGRIKYFQAVGIDTTERNIAEQALRKSEEKMSSIFRVAPSGIGLIRDNVIIEVNPYLCEMTGYLKEELTGIPIDFLYEGLDSKHSHSSMNIPVDFCIAGTYETTWVRKDGHKINVLLSSTLIDESDISKGCTFNVLDITNRKLDEIELIKAKNRAEESDKLKTAFLQNLSHEIRTPLNGILGFAELINEMDLTKDDIKSYTSIILQSGKRLLNIVNNVLDISKIQTGQINLERRTFSVNSLFLDLYTFFSPQTRTKNITLKYNINCKSKIFINTDEAKLHQILTNLIGNAIKFTKEGMVEYSCEIDGNNLKFAVRDTGIGISQELFDKIFDRFVQAEQTSSREFEGTGLGLAICKGLIEHMGGKIWVDSVPGNYTIFYFTLPYNQEFFEYIEPGQKLSIINKRFEGKVLVADDDFNSFYYISRILENTGLEIFHAENGEEVVEALKKSSDYDLIFIDIRMPKLDGIGALSIIRQINPKIPVIAQTAFAFSEEREKIIRLGFDEYISKPIERSKLIGLIEKYIKILDD